MLAEASISVYQSLDANSQNANPGKFVEIVKSSTGLFDGRLRGDSQLDSSRLKRRKLIAHRSRSFV